jgi:prepilin-type N-terminal cleavage/methylation domain-containing protein
MWAKNKQTGFTIVELLIVIVVIGILAAITIVAYNGVQARARDSQRVSDLQSIQKALELYKAQHGTYPPSNPTTAAICASHTNGYSYSDATDGTWLNSLVTNKVLSKAPVSPDNGCAHHYSYLYVPASNYGCTGLRTANYYILQIVGTDGAASIPSGAVTGTWRPCTGATAGWSTTSTSWTFQKDDV